MLHLCEGDNYLAGIWVKSGPNFLVRPSSSCCWDCKWWTSQPQPWNLVWKGNKQDQELVWQLLVPEKYWRQIDYTKNKSFFLEQTAENSDDWSTRWTSVTGHLMRSLWAQTRKQPDLMISSIRHTLIYCRITATTPNGKQTPNRSFNSLTLSHILTWSCLSCRCFSSLTVKSVTQYLSQS